MSEITWTKPYYGVSHSMPPKQPRQCTVSELQSCTTLVAYDYVFDKRYGYWRYLPSNATRKVFDSADDAKAYAERWITTGET